MTKKSSRKLPAVQNSSKITPNPSPPTRGFLTPDQYDQENEYYRAVWGFDPVKDCTHLGQTECQYEAWFLMSGDPTLSREGVEVGARVRWQAGQDKSLHNQIVFRANNKEGKVDCVHLAVGTIPAEQAQRMADGEISPNLSQGLTHQFPVELSPATHFAALKSFTAAIAEFLTLNDLLNPYPLEWDHTRGNKNKIFSGLLDDQLRWQVLRALSIIIPRMVPTWWELVPFPRVTHPGDLATMRTILRNLGEELGIDSEDLFSSLINYPDDEEPAIPHLGASDKYLNHNNGTFYQARDGRVVGFTLSKLNLGTLPPAIALLDALEFLRVNSCDLTVIPPWIESLKNLQELYLDGNPFTVLPSEIGALTQLEILDLGRCQLTSIPAEMGGLTSLRKLTLYTNPSIILPTTFGGLTSLEELLSGGGGTWKQS